MSGEGEESRIGIFNKNNALGFLGFH